jgi:hypothetical protein
VEINHQQLDQILADFSALGRPTYLDDPVLGLGYAATDRDELGIPQFSPDLPRVPVALIERHQALWTHPDNPGPREEVWTATALSHGMQRLSRGVRQLPNLDGWVIAEWPRDGGGLQLQQPDGNLFVYAVCDVDPEWADAARGYGSVLVLHGPQLGLRVPADLADADLVRPAELETAHDNGLVTGGLMQWGQARNS